VTDAAGGPALGALRSLLFVPASRCELVPKAAAAGCDAVIVDLEDAVAPERRPAAREAVAAVVAGSWPVPIVVRVNPAGSADLALDLEAAVGPGLGGVMLPKADTPSDVLALAAALGPLEARAGLAGGSIGVIPLVESCLGVHYAWEIARASPRIRAVAFSSGEQGDFMADLGGRWTPGGEALHHARSRLLCEARAAGIDVVLDGVFMNLDDERALRRECELARTLGYDGKLAIHPRQVPVINAAFTPSESDVRASEAVIAAFEAARREGRGAFRHDGMMVDEANVKVARRTLAAARRRPETPAP
jgi:citrate lyase subunit beta/citryl-CoA lyase